MVLQEKINQEKSTFKRALKLQTKKGTRLLDGKTRLLEGVTLLSRVGLLNGKR